jgi:hypothetical protein
MKLIDSILISLTVALLMIFTDQTLRLKHSLGETYFILMLAIGSFLYLRYIRQKRKADETPVQPKTPTKKKKK